MWNFVVSRSGASLRCNRSTRPGSSARKVLLRTSSSIVGGCGWCIRFNWVVPGKRQGIDKVKMTYICGSHTNTCGPSNVDQLVLTRTRASYYKKCTDQVLSEIMVRIGDSYNINVQPMIEILRKALPQRKGGDHHMVCIVRLRARHLKLTLEVANVKVAANHFDTSFIKDYVSNSDNYSIGDVVYHVLFMLFDCII